MQAIASDIIVNQAITSGQLQISQNLNNSSSNNVSFADMVASLNKVAEQKTTQETSEVNESVKPQDTQQAKPVEKSKDSDKTEKIQDEQLTKTEQKEVADAPKSDTVKKQNGETNLNKKPAVKTGETVEPVKKDTPETKKGEVKEVQTQQKNEVKTDKKVLNDDEKKALLEKQQLEMLEKQSGEPEQVENAEILAALAGDALQMPLEEASGAVKQNVQDFSEKTVALDVKANVRSEPDFESKNIKDKISVVDLRTKPETAEDSKPVEKTSKNLKVEYTSGNSATVTMELDQQIQTAGENILSLDNQTAAANGSDFQAMVTNQIEASIPEFVQTGTVLLKDNDKGTINLVLHPDDLGNVKIHLSMDGKTISAHITVNTKEALEVFKDNAQTLREAFAKNGYDTASFDVSYNGSSGGQHQNQNFEGRYDGMEYMARNAYSDFAGVQDDGYIQNGWEMKQNSEYSINIVA